MFNKTSDITEQCIQGSPFSDIVQYNPQVDTVLDGGIFTQAGLTSMFLVGSFFVSLTMFTLTWCSRPPGAHRYAGSH